MQQAGKYMIIAGLLLALIGATVYLFGNKLNWFGNLPGDVKVEKEGFRFYAPFVSMLLLSLFVSAALWVINRFFR